MRQDHSKQSAIFVRLFKIKRLKPPTEQIEKLPEPRLCWTRAAILRRDLLSRGRLKVQATLTTRPEA